MALLAVLALQGCVAEAISRARYHWDGVESYDAAWRTGDGQLVVLGKIARSGVVKHRKMHVAVDDARLVAAGPGGDAVEVPRSIVPRDALRDGWPEPGAGWTRVPIEVIGDVWCFAPLTDELLAPLRAVEDSAETLYLRTPIPHGRTRWADITLVHVRAEPLESGLYYRVLDLERSTEPFSKWHWFLAYPIAWLEMFLRLVFMGLG